MRQIIIKVSQNFRTEFGTCCFYMSFNQVAKFFFVIFVFHFFDGNHGFVQVLVKNIIHIQYICDTAAHTCCKVLASLTKYDYAATCHIFTAVLSYAFYNCRCTGVTDCETLTCNTIDKCSTTGCTVEGNITYNNILFCFVCSFLRNPQDQFTTGKSFSEVVITVTGQFQCKSFGDKCTEALSAGTVAVYSDSVICKSVFILSGNLCTKDGSECTVNVCQIYRKLCFLTFIDGICAFLNQNLFIHGLFQFEVIYGFRVKSNFLVFACERIVQDCT